MDGLLIGFARVSTHEQDLTGQRDALADLGVAGERVCVDHVLYRATQRATTADPAAAEPTTLAGRR